MMDREWIDDVKIEHRGEDGGMNITMFVRPPCANYKMPMYCELVAFALNVFRDVVDPDVNRFEATYADVMAWSDKGHRGIMVPHRYRVTVDFELKGRKPGSQEPN